MTAPPMEPIASEAFREVIGHFASGVTVITTIRDARPLGTTASALTSLSLEPPALLVCMNTESSTGRAIAQAGRFAVNILDEDQVAAAVAFARKAEDKFERVDWSHGITGMPLLQGALATIECRVTEEVAGGTHTVFIGAVDAAAARSGAPLAYFRGRFGRLVFEPDESN